MGLKEESLEAIAKFDYMDSNALLAVIEQIKPHLKSSLTQEYLDGKITAIKKSDSEDERKKLCKNLIPYLDWYISGNQPSNS